MPGCLCCLDRGSSYGCHAALQQYSRRIVFSSSDASDGLAFHSCTSSSPAPPSQATLIPRLMVCTGSGSGSGSGSGAGVSHVRLNIHRIARHKRPAAFQPCASPVLAPFSPTIPAGDIGADVQGSLPQSACAHCCCQSTPPLPGRRSRSFVCLHTTPAMTTFAPASSFPSDFADTPHHDVPPPRHLAPGPFAHQLQRPNPPYHARTPQIPRRASRDLRHPLSNGAMAAANSNGPMPVPGGRTNGNAHGASTRDLGFGGPRSPPSNKSRADPE